MDRGATLFPRTHLSTGKQTHLRWSGHASTFLTDATGPPDSVDTRLNPDPTQGNPVGDVVSEVERVQTQTVEGERMYETQPVVTQVELAKSPQLTQRFGRNGRQQVAL